MKELRPFRFWCHKIIPLIYDDSLSYYEVLCKLVVYLNKVIENENAQNDAIEDLIYNFNILKNYVDHYFDNVDLQAEIDKKLDEMAESGALADLIRDYLGEQAECRVLGYEGSTDPSRNYLQSSLIICGDTAKTGVLIDCGTYPESQAEIDAITHYLDGTEKINHIVISHYHGDHAGGFKYLCDTYPDKVAYATVYLPPFVNRSVVDPEVAATEDEVTELARANNMTIVRPTATKTYDVTNVVKLKFYNTVHDYYYTLSPFDYNACSLCCEVINGNTTIWFPGDINAAAQNRIAPDLHKTKIACMAHHGSNVSIDHDYFYKIVPDAYIVHNGNGSSVSGATRYLDKYSAENFLAQERDIPVFATSNNGYMYSLFFNSFAYDFRAGVLPNTRTGHEYYSMTDWTEMGSSGNQALGLVEAIEKMPNNTFAMYSPSFAYKSVPDLGDGGNVMGLHFKTNSSSSVGSYDTGEAGSENLFFYLGLFMRNLYGQPSDLVAVHASRQGENLDETDYSVLNVSGDNYVYAYSPRTAEDSGVVDFSEHVPYWFGDWFDITPDGLVCKNYGLFDISVDIYSHLNQGAGNIDYRLVETDPNTQTDAEMYTGISGTTTDQGRRYYYNCHATQYIEQGHVLKVIGSGEMPHTVRITVRLMSRVQKRNKETIIKQR